MRFLGASMLSIGLSFTFAHYVYRPWLNCSHVLLKLAYSSSQRAWALSPQKRWVLKMDSVEEGCTLARSALADPEMLR